MHSLSSKDGFTNLHFTIQGLKTMALAYIQNKANKKQRIERQIQGSIKTYWKEALSDNAPKSQPSVKAPISKSLMMQSLQGAGLILEFEPDNTVLARPEAPETSLAIQQPEKF